MNLRQKRTIYLFLLHHPLADVCCRDSSPYETTSQVCPPLGLSTTRRPQSHPSRHGLDVRHHAHGRGQDACRISQPSDGDSRYNELMNCQVKDELVSQLIILNNKLNLLSPDLVHGDKERAEVQERRESLYAEIKHHRAKGHEGKPCPAARQV
jgi:hypothetical protein